MHITHNDQLSEQWQPEVEQEMVANRASNGSQKEDKNYYSVHNFTTGRVVAHSTRQQSGRSGQYLYVSFVRAILLMKVRSGAWAMEVNLCTFIICLSRCTHDSVIRVFLWAVTLHYTQYIMWHNFPPTRSSTTVNSLLLITQNTPVNLGAVHWSL